MAEWLKFDGSEEHRKLLRDASDFRLKLKDGTETALINGSCEFAMIDQILICERHPYADMIIEWARTGRPVYQLMPNGEWRVVKRPWWNPLEGYSFDPPKFKLVYRVSLLNLKDEGFVTAISTHKWLADELEKKDYFVRWLTDWQEVEV